MPLPNTTILHDKADSAPDKQKITERRHTYVQFSPGVRKELRLLAAKRDVTMTDLIREAIDNYLRSQGDTEQ